MFNHLNHKDLVNILGYDDLETITTSSGRKYILPAGECESYPSVTTVLSILSADHIEAWKRRVGEEEAAKISYRASSRGTAVHSIIEKYVENDPDYKLGFMPNVIESFQSVKSILDSRVGRIFGQELALYSDHLGLAGRVDCVAEFDGVLSIIDYKTSRKTKKKSWIENYFIQETAYAIMFEERTGIPINNLVTIIAVDNEDSQVFIENRDNWTKKLINTIEQYKQGKKI
jgi:genome maintenance exonuclease 1